MRRADAAPVWSPRPRRALHSARGAASQGALRVTSARRVLGEVAGGGRRRL